MMKVSLAMDRLSFGRRRLEEHLSCSENGLYQELPYFELILATRVGTL